MTSFSRPELAAYLDHTILKPDATQGDVDKVVDEALRLSCFSVCIEMKWLTHVAKRLAGSPVIPITVISFPGGNDSTAKKMADTKEAISMGAKEIDMVLNRGLLKEKAFGLAEKDISSVVGAAGKIPVKVILETSELDRDEIVSACVICKLAGANFVKTSTGFSKAGATAENVALMRKIVGSEMGVKASGGVRSYEDAIKMIEAGASRIGTSGAVAIIDKIPGGVGSY